jgi:hypothetical protein
MRLRRLSLPAAPPATFILGAPGMWPPIRPPDSRCEDDEGERDSAPTDHRQSGAGPVTKLTFYTPHGTTPAIPPGDRGTVIWRGHESHD